MASSTAAPPSLTLSSVLSQEFNPIIPPPTPSKPYPVFFNHTKSLALFPLVLQSRGRKPSLTPWFSSDGSLSKSVVVAAVAEVAEVVEQQNGEADTGGEGGVAVAAPPTKPKKGKAALPLKRDRHFVSRVGGFLEFCIVASSVVIGSLKMAFLGISGDWFE